MTGFICGRYFLYVLATYVLMMVVGLLFDQFGWKFPTGAGTFITGFIPAYWAGNTFYKTFQSVPGSGSAWKLSFYFTAIHLVFSMIILVLMVSFVPEFKELANTTGVMLLILATIFFGTILLLVTRFSFMFGAKQTEKTNA